jgi:protein-disulfide isomerase
MSFKPYLVPGAIILGALIVATAILLKDYGVTGATRGPEPSGKAPTAERETVTSVSAANAFRTEGRRLYGNPDAPVTIVEFSDLECPFCGRLHTTLKQVVDDSSGMVNWEYRHLPLPMHQHARAAAIASECVARLKNNDAFWQYLDVLFANIGSANPAFLKREAGKLGLTAEAYDACIADTEVSTIVDTDIKLVTERFGQQGTPFSLVVKNADDSAQVINGALPRVAWDQVITKAQE